MKPLLPEVLSESCDASRAALVLRVPAALIHFEGHFPGFALLPGVVQIDWAVRLARRYFPLSGRFSALENVKFQALILPDAQLTLSLSFEPEAGRFSFDYANGERKCSSGRIVFAGAR